MHFKCTVFDAVRLVNQPVQPSFFYGAVAIYPDAKADRSPVMPGSQHQIQISCMKAMRDFTAHVLQ